MLSTDVVSMEWVIGIAALAALCGALIGSRFGAGARTVKALQDELAGARKDQEAARSELAAARKEHDDYRASVVQQFEQTAVKFRQATDSYVELHNQLATSASVLCGEVTAGTLLEGTSVAALTDQRTQSPPSEAGIVVTEAQQPSAQAPDTEAVRADEQPATAAEPQSPLSSAGGSSR